MRPTQSIAIPPPPVVMGMPVPPASIGVPPLIMPGPYPAGFSCAAPVMAPGEPGIVPGWMPPCIVGDWPSPCISRRPSSVQMALIELQAVLSGVFGSRTSMASRPCGFTWMSHSILLIGLRCRRRPFWIWPFSALSMWARRVL